jgi:hypothetical protein
MKQKISRDSQNIILTGIPRSGTSYLCNLLHRFDNCVVLNEPSEIFPILKSEAIPRGMPEYYAKIREDVKEGRKIPNKLKDGKIVEDTVNWDKQSEYVPQVKNGDFALGTKNTIAYLSRFAALRAIMPEATFVVSVRNPFQTLASWKRSFPHLKNANVSALPVGSVNDAFLPADQRSELARISSVTEPAIRRAEFWNYLGGLILENLSHLVLIRYEELVANPLECISPIRNIVDLGDLREPIEPSEESKKHAEGLEESDIRAIHQICAKTAKALGVWTP